VTERMEDLEEVIAELQPVVRAIVLRKIGGDQSTAEIDDLVNEVIVKVLDRLKHLREHPDAEPIDDLRSYTAVVAYNACHALLRSRNPRRWRLKNRVRYVATHDRDFAMWETERGEMFCALARWRDRAPVETVTANASLSLSNNLREILYDALDQAKGPIEIDALVNRLVEAYGIDEATTGATAVENAPDSRVDFASTTERRSYLQSLWSEICGLPVRQRIALLLNLRDLHEGVITLLPLTGIASIRKIAEALEIPAKEFAQLWNELPIDDAAIARRLGVTGQQVINLRKSARARLARRMRGR
jgi:DNA-directed RNA polymerase specialized sigma24 family protein